MRLRSLLAPAVLGQLSRVALKLAPLSLLKRTRFIAAGASAACSFSPWGNFQWCGLSPSATAPCLRSCGPARGQRRSRLGNLRNSSSRLAVGGSCWPVMVPRLGRFGADLNSSHCQRSRRFSAGKSKGLRLFRNRYRFVIGSVAKALNPCLSLIPLAGLTSLVHITGKRIVGLQNGINRSYPRKR